MAQTNYVPLIGTQTVSAIPGKSGAIYAGDYSGVAPAFTPPAPSAAKDTVTGQVWWYDGTAWA